MWAAVVPVRALRPDLDQLRNKRAFGGVQRLGDSLVESLAFGGGARVKGRIPPEQLVRVAITRDGRRGWARTAVVGSAPPAAYPWVCAPGWREAEAPDPCPEPAEAEPTRAVPDGGEASGLPSRGAVGAGPSAPSRRSGRR